MTRPLETFGRGNSRFTRLISSKYLASYPPDFSLSIVVTPLSVVQSFNKFGVSRAHPMLDEEVSVRKSDYRIVWKKAKRLSSLFVASICAI